MLVFPLFLQTPAIISELCVISAVFDKKVEVPKIFGLNKFGASGGEMAECSIQSWFNMKMERRV